MMISDNQRQLAIAGLVSEMRAMSESLEEAIQEQLAQSAVKRRSDAMYPVAARELGARITNLQATIATLELEAARFQAGRAA